MERRGLHRYAVNFPCIFGVRGALKAAKLPELQAVTQNISTGGLAFVASAAPKVGTRILLELRMPLKAFAGPDIVILCRGKIAWIIPQENCRFGVGVTIERYKLSRLRTMENRICQIRPLIDDLSNLQGCLAS